MLNALFVHSYSGHFAHHVRLRAPKVHAMIIDVLVGVVYFKSITTPGRVQSEHVDRLAARRAKPACRGGAQERGEFAEGFGLAGRRMRR